jgi:hypothetical protein
MNNLKSIEKIEYIKADPINLSLNDHLTIIKKKLYLCVTVVYLLLLDLYLKVFKLFGSSTNHEKIAGKLCLVTGGANGLGRCIALRFAAEGCNIAIVDIVSSESTVKEISNKFSVKCEGFQCDVSDNEAIKKMKVEVESSLGKVDILVNNAGLLFFGTLSTCSIENIQKCVDVNLVSHFKVSSMRVLELCQKKLLLKVLIMILSR